MYLSNVDEQVKRARQYLEQMETYDLARNLRREPEAQDLEDWRAFRAALEAFVAAPAEKWEGGTFQASVAVYETLGLLWNDFHGDLLQQRRAAEKAKEQAALEAATYEVQVWRKDGFAPAHRVARTTVDEWFTRPGHAVVSQPYKAEARGSFDGDAQSGHPSGGYSMRTTVIGAELPEGTVKSKRTVVREGKRMVEYLVKKRGKTAEAKYQRAQRLKELRERLDTGLDYMAQDQIAAVHAEIKQLESQQ